MVDIVRDARGAEYVDEGVTNGRCLSGLGGVGCRRVDAAFGELHLPGVGFVGEGLTQPAQQNPEVAVGHLGQIERREHRAQQVGRIGVIGDLPLSIADGRIEGCHESLDRQHGVVVRWSIVFGVEVVLEAQEHLGLGLMALDLIVGRGVVVHVFLNPGGLIAVHPLPTADVKPDIGVDLVVNNKVSHPPMAVLTVVATRQHARESAEIGRIISRAEVLKGGRNGRTTGISGPGPGGHTV